MKVEQKLGSLPKTNLATNGKVRKGDPVQKKNIVRKKKSLKKFSIQKKPT